MYPLLYITLLLFVALMLVFFKDRIVFGLIILRLHILHVKSKRDIMCQLLYEFDDVLVSHGQFYWIGEGTALGAIREGDIIDSDEDVDVGIWLRDKQRFMVDILPDLEARGFRVGRVSPFSIYKNGHYIDIDFTGSGAPCMAIAWPQLCDEHIGTLEPFETAPIRSRRFVVPSMRYIERLYGQDWHIPRRVKPSQVEHEQLR